MAHTGERDELRAGNGRGPRLGAFRIGEVVALGLDHQCRRFDRARRGGEVPGPIRAAEVPEPGERRVQVLVRYRTPGRIDARHGRALTDEPAAARLPEQPAHLFAIATPLS